MCECTKSQLKTKKTLGNFSRILYKFPQNKVIDFITHSPSSFLRVLSLVLSHKKFSTNFYMSRQKFKGNYLSPFSNNYEILPKLFVLFLNYILLSFSTNFFLNKSGSKTNLKYFSNFNYIDPRISWECRINSDGSKCSI